MHAKGNGWSCEGVIGKKEADRGIHEASINHRVRTIARVVTGGDAAALVDDDAREAVVVLHGRGAIIAAFNCGKSHTHGQVRAGCAAKAAAANGSGL